MWRVLAERGEMSTSLIQGSYFSNIDIEGTMSGSIDFRCISVPYKEMVLLNSNSNNNFHGKIIERENFQGKVMGKQKMIFN